MAKYWPISSPWPFANYQRLLPLLRLSCCIMQFSLRFLLRLIPPNRTISSLYKYVGRDMIYSCTTIFVIGRCRVVTAPEERNESLWCQGQGFLLRCAFCIRVDGQSLDSVALHRSMTWNGAWISLWKLSKQ